MTSTIHTYVYTHISHIQFGERFYLMNANPDSSFNLLTGLHGGLAYILLLA